MNFDESCGQRLFALVLILVRSMLSMLTFEVNQCPTGKLCGGSRREIVPGVKGLLSCARHCGKDRSCLGVVSRETEWSQRVGTQANECHMLRACYNSLTSKECDEQMPQPFEYYAKVGDIPDLTLTSSVCQKCGVWDTTENKCKCTEGSAGVFCELDVYGSCKDFFNTESGRKTEKFYSVYFKLENGSPTFRVLCSLSPNGKEVRTYMFKSQGEVNFNRAWHDYEEGFFYDEANRWIGLRNINILCESMKNPMGVLETVYQSGTNRRRYNNFHDGNSSTNYILTVGKVDFSKNGDVGIGTTAKLANCLAMSNDAPFSTYDSENCDCQQRDCVSRAGAPWWFKNCTIECSPLGRKYVNLPQPQAEDRILLPGHNLHDSVYAEEFKYVGLFFKSNL
ncbi:angiopoietin-1-like [Aplysia californica]|uniref:Angiopoietin-1-like n=1 Tax=Aplysia californica TaxID=6500 RepID=A0ABM0JVT0_APLCA|nr:angiopoietin-1-like [Aplysia californica]